MAIPDGAGPPQPHTVIVHNVFGCGVIREPNGQKLLILQSPSGEAHHYRLEQANAKEIGAQLMMPGVHLPGMEQQ